jgi:hypothetical protein
MQRGLQIRYPCEGKTADHWLLNMQTELTMNWRTHTLKLFLLCALALFLPSGAWAQATRTWVSGVGDDANPCSRTAPCKTFAGAISKTATDGEISVLDPGGFGAVTITKSITIDGGGGPVAGILSSGTNGVIINMASGNVFLRNLTINGAGTGLNGIRLIQGGNLRLENVSIERVTGHCLDVQPTVADTVTDLKNVVGSKCAGNGVNLNSAVAATVNVDGTRLVLNGIGISATGAGALVRLSNSTVLNNGTAGLAIVSGANITSYNNNILVINGADAPTTTVYPR